MPDRAAPARTARLLNRLARPASLWLHAIRPRDRAPGDGAELYISPKTAGVHVSNILRKSGVSGRVQAAALAERAALLDSAQP